MLHATLPLFVPLAIEQIRASRVLKLLLIGAVVVLAGLAVVLPLHLAAAVPECTEHESMLVYPRYGSRGMVEGYTYRCGQPHRSCQIRDMSAQRPFYDCSPFMIPRDVRAPLL